ncbi:hypothetical protein EYR36_001555 [Pleurotus pulmonarius]|nr:hypothetical protein EYR36_001555 [Pleurotus pulmonarius]
MSQEMSGRWVGPCKVADFFKLAMPMELRKGSKEKLPKIDKKFFAGKKPANKKAMVKKTIEFFGTDNFSGIQLVDTSSRPHPNSKRGAKLRPGLSLRDKSDVIDPNSPTQLGEASCGLEVEDNMIEILSDRGPLFELETDTAQQMSRVERGYDPTVQVADEFETKLARERLKEWEPKHERPVFKMEVYGDQKMPNPRKFLVWGALADPESPLGRATRGYPALEVTHGLDQAKEAPIMFLKEQWRSIALRPEINTLRELKDKGVKHVPTLECGGDLPGQVTRTATYTDKIGKRGTRDIDTRIHVRFVVVEVGRPIERFSSSKEMLKAVYDAFQGHKQAYEECKLLHRDVSGGNILLVKDGGILNDWDMAVNVEEVERGPRAHERTGTWAFMSIDLLMGAKRPHRISDDLESFFWVVLYYSLLFLPHNKVDKLHEIITGVFEQYTYYSEAEGGTGKYFMVMKGECIGDDAPRPLEFTANEPLTDFVWNILTLLKDRKEREPARGPDRKARIITTIPSIRSLGRKRSEVPPPPTEQEMRDDMEKVFKFVLSMAWPTDDKAKLHTVRKPTGATGQAPAEGTAKRKRTVQEETESDTEGHKSKKAKSIPQLLEGGPEERKTRRLPANGIRRSTRLHKRY